jgi:hypothetical protein
MHDSILLQQSANHSVSEIFAGLALIISIVSLVTSVYLVHYSKKIEIVLKKFDQLCYRNVQKILSNLDSIVDAGFNNPIGPNKSVITDIFVDLQTFLVNLKGSVYSDIDLGELIVTIEGFTDKVYNNNYIFIGDIKGDYYSTKLKIFSLLYSHAIKKEISIRWIIIRPFKWTRNELRRIYKILR